MANPRVEPGARALPALDFISHSPEQTRRIGRRLGQHARAGDVYFLSGPFGAGKTLLAQGFAAGLGVTGTVTSPSFTLINEYAGADAGGARTRLYHIDLYRLDGPAALASIGLEDYLADPQGICVIEWPERIGPDPAAEHLLIALSPISETKRRLTLAPHGARYARLLLTVKAEAFGVEP